MLCEPTFENKLILCNMSDIILFIMLIIASVLLWLVNSYIPLRRKPKAYLNVLIMIAIVVLFLKSFDINLNQNGDSHLEINKAAMGSVN